jgi:hypothetical protein
VSLDEPCETCGAAANVYCECADPHFEDDDAQRDLRIELVRQEMLESLQIRWIRNLTRNLAVGAALCRSFEIGVYAAASWTSGQLDGQNTWEPGCGRSAAS